MVTNVKSQTRRKSHKGLKGRMVNWQNMANMDCLTLIDHGLHAATISKMTGMSISQIHYRAKLAGQRLRDYRDGKGPRGSIVFKQFRLSTMSRGVQDAIVINTCDRIVRLEKIQQARAKKKKRR